MAGVLSGTARAPVTAVLLAFELTHDYAVILPVMLASAISILVARALHPDSIYTAKLTARGIDLDRHEDVALRRHRVGDVMHANPPAVRADAPLDVVLARFLDSDLGTVFVLNAQGGLVGQASIHDVKETIADTTALGGIVVAGDVAERSVTADVATHLAEALDRLARERREVLAVVDAEGRLQGAVSLRAIMDVLAREALRGEVVGVSTGRAAARDREALRLSSGLEVRSLAVPFALRGETVRSLDVRSRFRVSVIALRRDGVDAGVDPDHPFEPGDTLVVMGDARAVARFGAFLGKAAS
jgi:CBS domain-containing protein